MEKAERKHKVCRKCRDCACYIDEQCDGYAVPCEEFISMDEAMERYRPEYDIEEW